MDGFCRKASAIVRLPHIRLGSRHCAAPTDTKPVALTTSPLSEALCFGLQAFRAGLFPMLFLLFMVPVPHVVLDLVVTGLQKGSAEVSFLSTRISSSGMYSLNWGIASMEIRGSGNR